MGMINVQDYVKSSEVVSLFCRINMNAKRDLPIRAGEMGMLIFIVKSDSPPIPIKIAEFFKVTKPMVTAMANSLVKKGYLTKRTSPDDGRSYALLPTEKGILLVDETYVEYCKSMEKLKSKMGKKYNSLIELLDIANKVLLDSK